MNFRASFRSFGAIFRIARSTAVTVPGWARPFYWCAAACLLLFSAPILLVTTFCMSMRPLYESKG